MDINGLNKLADQMKTPVEPLSLAEQMKDFYQMSSWQELNRPMRFEIPKLPTNEERHAYESAGVLIERLAKRIEHWQSSLPEDAQPVILAVLPSGATVRVLSLAQESHHGIAITGLVENNECLLLTHQATLQLLCYVEIITAESPRRPIGFYVQSQATSSAEDE